MEKSINYTYKSKPIDTAVLSVLDVMSDGKIVSAADWIALWNTVLGRINHIDAYCSDINALTIDWQESVTAFEKAVADINTMFDILSEGFIHYGDEAPTDEHIRLWIQRSSEVDAKSLVNKTELAAAIVNSEATINAITDQKLDDKAVELKDDIINTYANTIKGSASGSAIAMRDVSPIEHSVGCSVESKNMLDPRIYVDTSNQGTVSILDDGLVKLSGALNGGTYAEITYGFITTEPCILTLRPSNEYSEYWNVGVYLNDTVLHHDNNLISVPLSVGTYELRLVQGEQSTSGTYIQLEKGTAPTDYKPYVDVSTVEVSRYGKNLLPNDFSDFENWKAVGDGRVYDLILPTGGYTFSFKTKSQGDINYGFLYIQEDGTSKFYPIQNRSLKNVTFRVRQGHKYSFWCSGSFLNELKKYHYDWQLERGATVTDYEPCNEQTKIANAYGIVNGVTSVSPNMTLISSNDGVVINCNYNVDTKTYIDNKFAELQALILEG